MKLAIFLGNRGTFRGSLFVMVRKELVVAVAMSCAVGCAARQFVNPVGSEQSLDPFVCRDADAGCYYLLFTSGREVRVFRYKPVATLREGDETGYPVMGICSGRGTHAVPAGEPATTHQQLAKCLWR